MQSKINSISINNLPAFGAKKGQDISCNAQKPDKLDKPTVPIKIAIVDSFTKKTKDINGDGTPDLAHGEVVEAVAKGNLRYSPEIIRFDDKSNGGEPSEKVLLNIFKKIEADKSIKAVNVSISGTENFSRLNDAYNRKFELPEYKNVINQSNASTKRKEMVHLLARSENDIFKKIIAKIENIAKNSAVFVAAGNGTLAELNSFNLAEGTIGVGSMATNDRLLSQDRYTKKSLFSGDNTTLNVFSKGEYEVAPILEDGTVIGYDITEDGIIDVPISKIKGYKVIEKFVGKDIADVAAADEDYEKLKEVQLARNWGAQCEITAEDKERISKKLYSLDKLLDYCIVDSQTVSRSVRKGNYTTFDSALRLQENLLKQDREEDIERPTIIFKLNNEKVVYNPHVVFGEHNSIGKLRGTSYATPTAFAEHVNSLVERKSK